MYDHIWPQIGKPFYRSYMAADQFKETENNQKLVYAYEEHKRYTLSHTNTPTYSDTSK